MLHSVIGGHIGPMHQLDNEMEEIRNIQTQYINILARETKMSERYLRNLMKKKVNVYLSAQEAVDLGIADEII
jgi:ATP-dependent protease ClpP protease subunit